MLPSGEQVAGGRAACAPIHLTRHFSTSDFNASLPSPTPSPLRLQVVMQLAAALRAAGHFTVVALTNPFEFEGASKAEAAAGLVAALRASAHLVAVMEQEVLMQVGGVSALYPCLMFFLQ